MVFGGRRAGHSRSAAVLLVFVLVAVGFYLVPTVKADGPTFSSTADFDNGTKNAPGDGNYGVETHTDDPAVASNRLALASLTGDSFPLPDSDADTFKWDIPTTCALGAPATIVRSISGGVLHLGSNKANRNTQVGVVQAISVSGDLDVRLKVDKIATQTNSVFDLQLLNEHRCDWFNSPKTADGVVYEWNEGPLDSKYSLQAFKINNGASSKCGAAQTLSVDPVYLRISRSVNAWTFSNSSNGVTWTQTAQCTFSVAGSLYPSFLETDPKGGVTTQFDLDDFAVVAGTLSAGGYRVSGDWTSPTFSVPPGQSIDHIAISGTFTDTFALDRTEIREKGMVLQAFDADNQLIDVPSGVVCGNDVSLRLFLKGDGTGTPVLAQVSVVYGTAAAPTTSETVTYGTSTGVTEQCGSDDVRETKTESLGPVSSTNLVDGQTIREGSQVSGNGPPTPSDVDAADGVAVQYQESSVVANQDTAPGSQTIGTGTQTSGTFPGCLAAADSASCTWTEGGATTQTNFTPASQTIAAGYQTAGSFPADIATSDNTRIEYQEGPSPVEPSADASIGTTINDNTRPVFRNPRGMQRSYVFYDNLTPADLVYRWSVDGVAWSPSVLINTARPDNFDLTTYDSGTDLKVFLVTVSSSIVKYRRGSIADTSDTIVWDPEMTIVTATKLLQQPVAATIARTANGRLVVAYGTDVSVGGANYRTTRLIGSSGDGAAPSWVGDRVWDDPSRSTLNAAKDQVTYTMASFGSGFPDRVLLTAHVPDPTSSTEYRYASAVPDWSGATFANAGSITILGTIDPADSLSCVIDALDHAHCLLEQNNDLFSAKSASAGNDDWGALISVQPPAQESGKSTLAIDLSVTPNVLYAIFDESSDIGSTTDFFYRTSPVDTISWSALTTITYPKNVMGIASESRDVLGSLHVAGIRDSHVLFYYELPTVSTAILSYAPSTQAILDGAEGPDPLANPMYVQGSFVRKTDGPGFQTIGGLGFPGQALILWWTRQDTFGTDAGHYAGIGLVASASQQYAIAWGDDDNVNPSVSGRRSAAASVEILSGGAPTLDGEASFTGFTADGWTLDWTTNPNPAQGTIIHFILLGRSVTNAFVGEFVAPPASVIGTRSYAGVGFHGDLAFFLSSLQASRGDAAGATMGFGAATGPANRGATSTAIPTGSSTNPTRKVQDQKAIDILNPAGTPTTDSVADFVSFDADGFTLNHLQTTTGNILFWALVIKGCACQVGTLTRPTVMGDQSITGLSFQPHGVLFFSDASAKSLGSVDVGGEFSMGAGSSPGGVVAQDAIWDGSKDGVTPTNANMHTSQTEVLDDFSLANEAVQNDATYKSSDPGGFTVTWTAVQTTVTGEDWFYVAMGPLNLEPPFPQCIRISDDSRCTYRETDQGGGNAHVEVKYGWSGVAVSGIAWRLFLEGRQSPTNPETILVAVYGSDGVTLSDPVCSIVSTSDVLYDCGTLTPDQLRSGSPTILFRDANRTGDRNLSSFELDRVFLQRTYYTKAIELRYGWFGIPTAGSSYQLRVEGFRSDEDILVQVLTPPSTWTTRLTIGSTSDVAQSYTLAPAEFDGGSPAVRFIDSIPGDLVPSFVRLDQVIIVELTASNQLSLRWDWASAVTPVSGATLEMRAFVSGDTEPILVQVWDWQDLGWTTAFTVTATTETAYSAALATACSPSPSDCQVSTPYPGSVRIRIVDGTGADPTATSLTVGLGVVRVPATMNALDVQYDWSSIGAVSGENTLKVAGYRGDEDMLVQVWDWTASQWNTRLTITSTTDAMLTCDLVTAEISPTFQVRIRFVGSNDVSTDVVSSVLWLDYVAIEKREYRLIVDETISGIPDSGSFQVVLEGRLSASGENFDVYVWDWASSAWTLWLSSPFTTADQIFARNLASSEISSGVVLVRIQDTITSGDSVASSVQIDLLEVVPA